MMPGKGVVTPMTTALFTQKMRDVLVPMRKAAMDAFLLGSLVALILIYSQVAFSLPWLILLAYALVYLAAFVLRLRKAAYDANLMLHQDQSVEAANETLVSEKTRIGLMLFWGNHPSI